MRLERTPFLSRQFIGSFVTGSFVWEPITKNESIVQLYGNLKNDIFFADRLMN